MVLMRLNFNATARTVNSQPLQGLAEQKYCSQTPFSEPIRISEHFLCTSVSTSRTDISPHVIRIEVEQWQTLCSFSY